jgi:PadR family transcriptional regulator, regulatory protein PadR
MSKREFPGSLEILVLSAVLRAGREASGIPIAREIEAATGRPVPLGSIYATLARLEEKGLVVSELGAPTPERGGRAKAFFRLTTPGLTELRHAQRALLALWDEVPEAGRGQA